MIAVFSTIVRSGEGVIPRLSAVLSMSRCAAVAKMFDSTVGAGTRYGSSLHGFPDSMDLIRNPGAVVIKTDPSQKFECWDVKRLFNRDASAENANNLDARKISRVEVQDKEPVTVTSHGRWQEPPQD